MRAVLCLTNFTFDTFGRQLNNSKTANDKNKHEMPLVKAIAYKNEVLLGRLLSKLRFCLRMDEQAFSFVQTEKKKFFMSLLFFIRSGAEKRRISSQLLEKIWTSISLCTS